MKVLQSGTAESAPGTLEWKRERDEQKNGIELNSCFLDYGE
jgi:hypothetical protein